MDLFTSQDTLNEQLVAPLSKLLNGADHQYTCHRITDRNWLSQGISRALCDLRSGCGFLQQFSFGQESSIGKGVYFEAFKSKRRLAHLRGLVAQLACEHAELALAQSADAGIDEGLSKFHIYAGDGHFHAASSHDQRDHKERKNAVGHLYALNLRNSMLTHLALSSTGNKSKPHDMGTLKKTEISMLRQGAKTGEKVLYIWDRAGIDFMQWHKWKQGSGIYVLSREKANMALDVIGIHPWDTEDPVNAGIVADNLVGTTRGVPVRRVVYIVPETGEKMSFLTNLPEKIGPGAIAQLYFMRWRIEKSFDELKNKMHETKAWASCDTAKQMQAAFTCLAYNLARLLSSRSEVREKIDDPGEKRKRAKRMNHLKEEVEKRGGRLPELRMQLQHPTQLSVKFYRWLRYCLERATSWRSSLDALQRVYANF